MIMNGLFNTKNLELELKDIDSVSRRVTVALSKFNNLDSDNDVILMGAFTKSILERGPESTSNRKIKALRYHDFEHEIGRWIKLEETHDYLIGQMQLGRSTKGDDALLDYEDGIITEHSIGFNLVQDKVSIREDGIREIKEVVLWEGSAVTFGANSETPVFSVGKSQFNQDYLDRLNVKMSNLISGIKNGKGTDERLMTLESQLRVIQSKYNSLINFEPKTDDTDSLNVHEPNPIINNQLSITKFI